ITPNDEERPTSVAALRLGQQAFVVVQQSPPDVRGQSGPERPIGGACAAADIDNTGMSRPLNRPDGGRQQLRVPRPQAGRFTTRKPVLVAATHSRGTRNVAILIAASRHEGSAAPAIAAASAIA